MAVHPDNRELVDLLRKLAQLLEIEGEEPFRARAFAKAAESIENLPDPVSAYADAGKLREIPGVGEGIAAVIREELAGGRIAQLDAIQERIPLSAIDLLSVPGLGPKTAQRLVRELGITDLDALGTAIDQGVIQSAPGFTAATEAKLARGLAAVRRRTGRYLLSSAVPRARAIVHALRVDFGSGSRVELTGSVRRLEETVGDINLIVAGVEPAAVIASLARFERTSPTLSEPDLVIARLSDGPPVRIRLVKPEDFGTAWIRTTGTPAHLALLGALPAAPTEESVYEALGLPWISPEIRQGRHEIEWARSGFLDQLVTVATVRGEFHCHTTWSDGTASVEEMARSAQAFGYSHLAITDHSRSLGVANGLDDERIAAQRADIDAAMAAIGMTLFSGSEIEVHRDGSLDLLPETRRNLDLVVASTHSGLTQPREVLTERILGVLRDPDVDILAHPSGRLIEQREGGDIDWARVFATAAETGVALEINADPARLDLSASHAEAALAAGCTITINCDAHSTGGFRSMEYGIAQARRAGLTADRFLNAWGTERVREWLDRPRG